MVQTREYVLCAFFAVTTPLAQSFIVDDGRPHAEIVIAKDAPRMVRLAAEDLHLHVRKMSGAELPVVTSA